MSDLEPGQARIHHPTDNVQDSVVPASAVPHWERAGWEFVEGDREDFPQENQRFEGQAQIRIRHPVTGGESVVAESAVPHWRSVGWQVVDEDAEAEVQSALEDRTVHELRELAKERGVSPIPSTKADLVEALTVQEEAGVEPAQPAEEGEQ